MKSSTLICSLKANDITPGLLDSFRRHQKVERCWRKRDGKLVLIHHAYVETWDAEDKREVTEGLLRCVKNGGRVLGAFRNGTLAGFASVEGALFGKDNPYANLSMLYVSNEYRNQGIGKILFEAACEQARQLGAKKLYISAHSAEDPMAFYSKLGCVEASEINQKMVEEEPCDCQLERVL